MDYKELLIELINNIDNERAIEYLYKYSYDFAMIHGCCSIQQTPLQSEQEYHVEPA